MQVFSLTAAAAAAAGQSERSLWQLLLVPRVPLKVVQHAENDNDVCFDASFYGRLQSAVTSVPCKIVSCDSLTVKANL